MCYTTPPPARGKPLWTPSCSALRFSHKKTREKSCQCFRQWIQKKGGECSNTPCPAGQFPRQNHRSETVKFFAPEEWRVPQGLLVCLVAEEATQDKNRQNGGQNLACHVQQELHHRQHLLTEELPHTFFSSVQHRLQREKAGESPGSMLRPCFNRASLLPVYPVRASRKPLLSDFGKGAFLERCC